MDQFTSYKDIGISILLVILVILFLDPFMIIMPTPVVYMIGGLFIVLFFVFAGMIWRERAADERDEYHRMFAGRVAYLAGAAVLVAGILAQAAFAHVDAWLVLALAAMIVAKLAVRIYAARRQ